MLKNFKESRRLARRHRDALRPHNCHANARLVLLDSYASGGAFYAEGFVVDAAGRVYGHAWLEVNGEVVDPTLPGRDLTYFPGGRLTAVGLRKQLAGRPDTGGPLGWGSATGRPAYARAFKAACRAAGGPSSREVERREVEWDALTRIADVSRDPAAVRAAYEKALAKAIRDLSK